MDRHKCYLIIVIALVTVKVSQKRHLLQEVRQINLVSHVFLTPTFNEVLHTAKKLLQILLTRDVLRIPATIDIATNTAVHNNIMPKRIGIF